jgi:predicted TIM-barrel fold metal-dependent hydrolase
MTRPREIGVIDLMLQIPNPRAQGLYDFMKPLLMDRESREAFEMPAQYMFKDLPRIAGVTDYVAYTLGEMDRYGIERAMVGVDFRDDVATAAVRAHPQRFVGSYHVDPNRGMDEIRALKRAVSELGARAATVFPAGYCPQVPINDKKMYPFYAACVELDIPIFVCAGVPGPRVPMQCQHVELIDEVCWYFPELRFVTRHGCEPWTELAVKLMLKYPNLYYSTSAFAPRWYPKAIVDFANTRGATKILYAGYFPMGLTLERIFSELDAVPFKPEVWPRFLRENALDVLKLR